MNIIHHNYIAIIVDNNLLYDGQVLIYEDNSCEGILSNQGIKYFTFGTFEKNKSLHLVVLTKNGDEIIFDAQKTNLQYEGECVLNRDDITTKIPFCVKVTNLDVDPRDYYPENNPANIFLEKINNYRKR